MRSSFQVAWTTLFEVRRAFGPLDHSELVHTIHPPFYNPEWVQVEKKKSKRSFAIKKISETSKDAFREIAYNIFKTNKQLSQKFLSQNDNLLNHKSSYLGSILSKSENACYIFMDKIEVSLRGFLKVGIFLIFSPEHIFLGPFWVENSSPKILKVKNRR